MRVCALTDFHGSSKGIEAASRALAQYRFDVILLAGDISFNDFELAKNLLDKLCALKKKIFFVPGNTDTKAIINYENENLQCIDGKQTEFQGYRILGLGGAPLSPFDTPYQWSDDKAAEILKRAHNKKPSELIILSHAPPKNTTLDKIRSGAHIGSSALRAFIEEVKPLLVICGHIHEAKGWEKIKETLIINPGPAYNGHTAVLELDDRVKIIAT